MYQVLFRIPIKTDWTPEGIPIYGFGLMLFLAFVICTWLAARRAEKEGIGKDHLQDLAIWIFVCGIIGARIVFMLQYHMIDWDDPIRSFFGSFFKIWEGGLVFYGSAAGGVIGYTLAYFFIIRKHHLSAWQLADIVGPSVALGLCLGRVGCFLNGCCWGNVATCETCPKAHFYLCNPSFGHVVHEGYQTIGGFTLLPPTHPDRLDSCIVYRVQEDSPAAASGLRPGDRIIKVNDEDIATLRAFDDLVLGGWKRGETTMTLTVERAGQLLTLEPFQPRTLGLHPTQLYESISMGLLFLLLTAFYPFRRRYGEVFVLFVLCYSVHRFLNEMLRDDTAPLADRMTLSENGSIVFFLFGVLLWLYLRKRYPAVPQPAAPKTPQPAAV